MNAPQASSRVFPDAGSAAARFALERIAYTHANQDFPIVPIAIRRQKSSYHPLISAEASMFIIAAAMFAGLFFYENGSFAPILKTMAMLAGSSN